MIEYGKAVRVGRAFAGITQTELARRIGKDASYISRIEAERRSPSLATLEKIAAALSLEVYQLLRLGKRLE
tara:strand:+ start:178 stop:390 length:213 start_codon:yes stop_codon:yes gene_type:complete